VSDFLDKVLATKIDEVRELKRSGAFGTFKRTATAMPLPPSFHDALRVPRARFAVIGEIKRSSPSVGTIRADIDAAEQAKVYEEMGASAVSVLTDATWFGGSHADLLAAAQSTSLPVLCKDFIIDPVQVYQARAFGASAVLLIADLLTDAQLDALIRVTQSLSLDTSSSLSRSLLRGLLGEAVRKSRARIEVTRGPAKGQVLPIMESAEHIRLGAGPQVELDLEEPKLASNPLLLVLGGHGYHVVAPPGIPVRVGDRRVVDPVRLRSGDVISLLKTRLAFVDPLQPAIDDLAELAQADDTETRPAVSVSSSGGAGAANAPNPRHVETIRQPMVKAGRLKAGERLILVIAILSLFAALGFLAVVLEIIEL